MREIVTILRDAQEKILNLTGISVHIETTVPREQFMEILAEVYGPLRGDSVTTAFEIMPGLVIRKKR